MKTLTQKLTKILAKAKGVRVDVVLARAAVLTGGLAALAPYVGLIPGKTGAAIAGACAIAAGLTPRITRAAGLLSPVYAGQVPLLKVLPELLRTLANASQIVSQAKADARTAEDAQQAEQAKQKAEQTAQDKLALVSDVAVQVAEILKTGEFTKTGAFTSDALSRDIPPSLKLDLNLDPNLNPSLDSNAPVLTSSVTVADKD